MVLRTLILTPRRAMRARLRVCSLLFAAGMSVVAVCQKACADSPLELPMPPDTPAAQQAPQGISSANDDSPVIVTNDETFSLDLTQTQMDRKGADIPYHGTGRIHLHALFSPGYEADVDSPFFVAHDTSACSSGADVPSSPIVTKKILRLDGMDRISSKGETLNTQTLAYLDVCIFNHEAGNRHITVVTIPRQDRAAFETYLRRYATTP